MTLQPPQPSRHRTTDSEERNYHQIRVRQDTNTNWLKNNPVPASGEWCYSIGHRNPPTTYPLDSLPPATKELEGTYILVSNEGETYVYECIAGLGGNGYVWRPRSIEYVEPQHADQCVKIGDGNVRWSELPWLGGRGPEGGVGPEGPQGEKAWGVIYRTVETVSAEGQTIFRLMTTVEPETSMVTINGVILSPSNYTLTSDLLTLTNSIATKAGDIVSVFSWIGAVESIIAGLNTADIETLSVRPTGIESKSRSEIKNQQEVNWYLLDKIDDLEIPEDQDLSGYVRKEGGDSMQGPLAVRPQGGNARETSKIQTLGVFSNSEGSALRLGTTRDRVYVGHNDVSINGPLKVDEIHEKNNGVGIEITDRVILKTEGVEDDEVVTKKYIDDKTRHLQDEIVELEEEIDAIAPSVERGKWIFTAVGTVAQPGQFTMYDADFGNGSPTGLFKSAKSIWFNEIDLDDTPHSFANVKDGELLEIFIDGSPEYGLFSVTREAHDETATGSKFWVVDVDFVRTNESTTAVGPGEICRFKIFEAPSGGEATSFVMKTGDTMSGKLQLDKPRGDSDNGKGFSVKGAIGDTYSSTTVSDQAGELFQAYHNADGPDAINYKGKIQSPNNIVTKEYVDSKVQSSSNSPVMLHSGSGYAYKFVDKGILSSSQFSSDSHQASSSYLYISRLWGQKRGWTQVVNYDRTEDTIIEVWQINSDGSTLLIIRAGINSIEQAEWTQHDAKLTLNRFWSKSGYSFSKFNDYTFMIHGLVERAELISPLGYSRGDEVKMQPIVQKNVEDI